MQAQHQHPVVGFCPIQRLLDAGADLAAAGHEIVLERARMPGSVFASVSCTLSSGAQNQRSASGSASASACALATDTSRSLLVPPNKNG